MPGLPRSPRQHGVIGHRQLVGLGLSRQAIHRRLCAGRLHRVHRGVYAVGHNRLTQRGRWMAAVLAGGGDAVLSHRSAAALWQILPMRGGTHVTIPRTLRKRDGINFHSQPLQLDEVTTHDGIPVTTVARTLLDIAAGEPDELERAFNEAEYRRLWDAVGVAELIRRHRGQPERAASPPCSARAPEESPAKNWSTASTPLSRRSTCHARCATNHSNSTTARSTRTQSGRTRSS